MADQNFKINVRITQSGAKRTKTAIKDLDGQTRSFVRNSNKASTATASFRRSMSGLRNNLLLIGFAFAGVIKVIGGVIRSSSDLQEVTNKFNVVFGESSESARKFAELLSNKLGRSFSDIMTLMAGLQDTFVPLGFARDDAAKLSQALAQLSIDVSSFNNAASADVAQRFTSAIVGNHEAVRGFGIILTEATVKQEALKLGLVDANGELDNKAKVLSRVNIILKSTTDAHGDSLKTIEDFANATKKFSSKLEILGQQFGDVLLPLATSLVDIGIQFTKTEKIKGYATALGIVAIYFGWVKRAAILAAAQLINFKLMLAKTGIGFFVIGLGELATKLIYSSDQADNLEGELLDLRGTIDSVTESIKESSRATTTGTEKFDEWAKSMRESAEKGEQSLQKELDLLNAKGPIQEYQIKVGRLITEEEKKLIAQIELKKRAMEEATEAEKRNIEEAEKAAEQAKILAEENLSAIKEIASAKQTIYQDDLDFQFMQIELQRERFEQMKLDEVAITEWAEQAKREAVERNLEETDILYNSFMGGYDAFVDSLVETDISGRERSQRVWDATKSAFIQFLGDIVKEQIKQFLIQEVIAKAGQSAAIASAAVTGTAIAAQFAVPASLAATASFGGAAVAGQAGITASIAATKALAAFAKGGDFITSGPQIIMVGDNPGGKERVQVTPLSSPSINGPQAGSTVVFNNPIMTEEFTKDHIIPMIQRSSDLNLA